MQTAFEQPLSPSMMSFINADMLTPSIDESTTNSDSIDLFRYYLDMSQAQQKEQQPSTIAPSMLSLQDLESFQSFLNANQPIQSSNNNNNTSIYPFAEASNYNTFNALPPSAFSPASISSGSEIPVDPRFHTFSNNSGNNGNQAVLPQIKLEEQPLALPVMPASTSASSLSTLPPRAAKRRAVSEVVMDDISEADEQEDEQEDDDSASEEENIAPPRKSARKSSSSTTPKKSASVSSKKKASTSSSSATASNPINHPHALVPVPEWQDRPSKAEYDKLSSKEKRQLRNKISARNFRHRRKAHIDTLEEEIGMKNGIIDGLREEVGTLRKENQGLKADIELLKKNWEEIAAKISQPAASAVSPVISLAALPAAASRPSMHTSTSNGLTPDEDDLYGPGSLPALSPPSSSASTNGDAESLFDGSNSNSVASTSTAVSRVPSKRISTRSTAASSSSASSKPNLRKDVSRTGTSFWDASASPFSSGFRGGAAGRCTDVHTTFVPELHYNANLSPSSSLSSGSSVASSLSGKKEKDPNLAFLFGYGANMNSAMNGLNDSQLSHLRDQSLSSSNMTKKEANESSFFESNPFLLLRNENLQDYRGQLYSKLANNLAGLQASKQASKLGQAPPIGLRPAFFSSSSSTTTTYIDPQEENDKVVRHVGALATKTLFEKLSGAFWDAFTGEQPVTRSLVPNEGKKMDGQKIADVLAGRKKLVVVEMEDELCEGLQKLELVKKDR